MPIHVELEPYEIPMVWPIQIGPQRIAIRRGVLLRIQKEAGEVRLGEIAPLPGLNTETLAEAYEQAQKAVGFTSIKGLRDWAKSTKLYPSVAFGLDSALDLVEADRNRIDVNALIFGLPSHWPRLAIQFEMQGFCSLKIKVARHSLADEIKALTAVRRVIATTTSIRLDANGGWDLKTALKFSESIKNLNIEYIEDPCKKIEDNWRFHENSPIPLGVDDCRDENHPFAKGMTVVLKPTQIGSYERIRRIVKQAHLAEASCVFSSSFETGVGLSAIANLARKYEPKVAHGLGTIGYLERDILDPPFRIVRGQIE